MSVGRWAICLPAQLGRMFVGRATTLCRLQRSRMFVVCWAFVSLPQRGSMFVGRATRLCRLQRSRMFVVCWAFVSLPQRGSMFVAIATTLCRLQQSRMFVVCWAFVSLPQRGSMFVGRATTLCRLQRSRMCPRSDPLKHVFFLKRDVEFPQQTQILSFEGLLCMVLPLIHDVSDDSVELRSGIRECAIALLPGESASDPALLVDPFIGISLDVPHKV